ncbi:MAG: hypothetical protein QOD56_3157 [Gammaproteobacteria bacterium]|jgi:hypothetical protein|nr:hypothetical protein [Gammaproteobacteria bacterium]
MIRDDSNEQAKQLTPCGRKPGTPLDIRHEIVAQALVRGKTNYEAGMEANYKIGPGLAGNISRLRRTPEMQERMAEIIAIAEEDARIENRWLIADLHLFRKASLANFWKRDRHGKLVLRRGKPVIDFSRATEEELRTLASFTTAKGRVKLEVRDPMQAIDRLARHRGLYHDALVNVNQVMGFNLSVLSDDELDAFKRLTEMITVRASESDEK